MLNKIPSIFPVLATKRLILRQPVENDAQQIFLLRSDSTVNRYLNRQPGKTTEEALNFIRKVNENFKNKEGIYWAITEAGSEKLIGTICVFDFSYPPKKCETGYELLPGCQGRGIMNEALEKVIAFTFKTLELDIMDAFTHKDNRRSSKLLLKCNFKPLKVTDGADAGLIIYRIVK
jgi:ribosomal-protein-alanine N-acetyltransferase